MAHIAVDLGTTNIKAAFFDSDLKQISMISRTVHYVRKNNLVEFEPLEYFDTVAGAVRSCILESGTNPREVTSIILTGQAESLVVIDEKGLPIRMGISWMDERSGDESRELSEQFPLETTYPITGQPAIIPTWPITKILWMKRNEPELFQQAAKFLMLKDYILYRLTGIINGEYSIYNFTHYLDIRKKDYWHDILAYCGVSQSQLPELAEPCTDIGTLSSGGADAAGLSRNTTVNAGTLDHFAGMIGTGNMTEGIISESAGTVLAIATLLNKPLLTDARIPCHYGPFKDSYVLLPVCESGGISLEWFKNTFAEQVSFDEINTELESRTLPNDLTFLPYLTGVNGPELDRDASGVFFGIHLSHDRYDFAYAVMEGVACLLKKNLVFFEKAGIKADTIISTGGGARSRFWTQLKADISGYTVAVPENEEAACLGAAIIGAVAAGEFSSYDEAVMSCVSMREEFSPRPSARLDEKYQTFNKLYETLIPVFTASSSQ